jgi:hypothetical protein
VGVRFVIRLCVLLDMVNQNHAKAPQSAEFVSAMRELFGDVQVLSVKEGSVELGKPDQTKYAAVSQISVKKDADPRSKDEASEEEEVTA